MIARYFFAGFLSIIICSFFGFEKTKQKLKHKIDSSEQIVRIEMSLSNFGVENIDFPAIEAKIDLSNGTNVCIKSIDSNGSQTRYFLSKTEMNSISRLMKISDIEKLRSKYRVNKTDQPESKTTIYTRKKRFFVDDYGLVCGHPLKELYKIVYKL
jgi:hypothetical protein